MDSHNNHDASNMATEPKQVNRKYIYLVSIIRNIFFSQG